MGVSERRAVTVTGIGLVTPPGCDEETVWRKLLRGESAAAFLPAGPLGDTGARYYCPVREATDHEGLSRHACFAVKAAGSAIRDAGLRAGTFEERAGVSVGSSKGAFSALEDICRARAEGRPLPIEACARTLFHTGDAALAIARAWGLRGPAVAPMAACATGAHAIFIGGRMIARGEADIVLAGAAEACLSPLLLAGYLNMGVLATDPGVPAHACKPYDRRRAGFVLGEGAGVVVLEERGHALSRGARIRAELKGGAIGEDVHHMTAPDPSGEALAGVISSALGAAGLAPGEIDYVNTHGTGTRHNDVTEARALRAVFSGAADAPPLSSTKPVTGHLLGAAGSVEFIIALMALERGIVPPTINLRQPDQECDLDYTPLLPRERDMKHVMSVSSGFGGHIGVLIAGKG